MKTFSTSIAEDFGNGGVIDGDVTISGDLTVTGDSAIATNEVIQGTSIIDVTNTEAFLVRKNSDAGDIFIVDTTNNQIEMYNTVGINATPTLGKLQINTSSNVMGLSINATDSLASQIHFTNDTTATTTNDGFKIGLGDDEVALFRMQEAKDMVFQTDSTTRMTITSAGNVKSGNGGGWYLYNAAPSSTVPAYAFADDTNTGMGQDGADNLTFISGGSKKLQLDEHTRISLANNTSFDGGTSNTVFGRLIASANNIQSGSNYNVFIGEEVASDGSLSSATNNVIVGYQAGEDLTSADNSVFVGYQAGKEHSQSGSNTAIGANSMSQSGGGNNFDNTFVGTNSGNGDWGGVSHYNTAVGSSSMLGVLNEAKYNTALGYKSMEDLTSGDANVGVGSFSGANITSGVSNVAIGSYDGTLKGALHVNTVGSFNIAMGTGALALANENDNDGTVAIGHLACTSQAGTGGAQFASATVGIGYKALTALTSGGLNTAIGYKALAEHQTQNNNTVLGYQAAFNTNNSHCADNTFIGTNTAAGSWAGTARYNTAVGMESMYGDMNGAEYNTALGKSALRAIVSGGNNVALGNNAGEAITTGSNNVIIGYDSEASAVGAANQIVIGASTTGLADNSVVLGNADVTKVYMASDGAAEIYANGTINTSDRRLKENIEDSDLGLEFVNKLRPVKYNYIKDKHDGKTKYGIIAQEVQEVLKESNNEDFAGIKDSDEYLGADYIQFVAPLIKAVQELSAKVKELESK